jgi:hypothetical protein
VGEGAVVVVVVVVGGVDVPFLWSSHLSSDAGLVEPALHRCTRL